MSAKTGEGFDALRSCLQPGQTVVFSGSSGVGKSTLINRLYGEEIQATLEVRESDAKGRHATTWRELILLPQGGLVIDTPGVREFHLWTAGEGVQEAFPEIEPMAAQCRFRDCSHTVEKGCAVREAVAAGQLDSARYESFLKLSRELEHLAGDRAKHARLARKRDCKIAQRAFNKFNRDRDRLE
jgi:ribosome biogenesis GTPase